MEQAAVEHSASTGAAPVAAAGTAGGESATEKAHTGEAPGAPAVTETGHAETTIGTERVLGLPADSAPAVAGLVIVSLALALAVWRRPIRPVLAGAGLFAAAATVFDLAEVAHQHVEGRTAVMLIAAGVAALHLAGAGTAVTAWAGRQRSAQASAAP